MSEEIKPPAVSTVEPWIVRTAEEFEAFTHNPSHPAGLPKILTTAAVAEKIRSRGHAHRFRQHAVEIVEHLPEIAPPAPPLPSLDQSTGGPSAPAAPPVA